MKMLNNQLLGILSTQHRPSEKRYNRSRTYERADVNGDFVRRQSIILPSPKNYLAVLEFSFGLKVRKLEGQSWNIWVCSIIDLNHSSY
jgi:hypothetical protein